MLPPPPPPPPLPQLELKQSKAKLSAADLFQSRAKTVRIGKVRWPPAPNTNLTFEYELQKFDFFCLIISI